MRKLAITSILTLILGFMTAVPAQAVQSPHQAVCAYIRLQYNACIAGDPAILADMVRWGIPSCLYFSMQGAQLNCSWINRLPYMDRVEARWYADLFPETEIDIRIPPAQ